MTSDEIETLFSTNLVTVGLIKKLAKQKYWARDTDICRVFVTRKSMCDQEEFVVRDNDCVKVSLVSNGELVLYKHGPAKAVLLSWENLTPGEIPPCTKCIGG